MAGQNVCVWGGVPGNITVARITLEKGHSPIRVQVLEDWLRTYPRKDDGKYLLDGFRYGFRIPAVGKSKAFMAWNLWSVRYGKHRPVREGQVGSLDLS